MNHLVSGATMTDQKLPKAIDNRSLFSDYYLQSLIQEQPEWLDTPALESVYAAVKVLYKAIQPMAEKRVEAQIEREWIQPILKLLEHAFEIQPTLPTSQGAKRPDYAFFADADALNAAQSQINTKAFFKTANAIGDAKAWSRDLDRKTEGSGDAFTNSNPSYQIDFYLRQADKMWGILTNGRQWRLYHRQTSYRLDCFYQVDVAALISSNETSEVFETSEVYEAFRYFYCLFRRDAFLTGADGKCFLERVLEGSRQHTVGVSEDLKDRVYEALRLLIGGFLNFPRNRFDAAESPLVPDQFNSDGSPVVTTSVVVSAAKATEVATTHQNFFGHVLEGIHENSLILLYRLLFILYAESRGLLPTENQDYATGYSLAHLAEDIYRKLDSGQLIIPTMSDYWSRLQGLFELINDGWENLIPQYNGGLFHPKRHPFLEKYHLGNDVLAKVINLLTRTENGERIVYRDLEVRHLGSIYEGLLEYKPRYAVAQVKQSEIPIIGAAGLRLGNVYLETDKGERKATGSYYTPDYIVRYIVENTLAPLCSGKSVADTLKLKVLDPAIGSGHFLVGVVDYLAEELATHPNAPLMTEGDSDTEIAYWRRRVVESCVYGVDVNPMAVELAKLSLWLHTVAKGEPLSFLDHHIRCGNSLLGAKIKDLPHLPVLKQSRRQKSEAQTEFAMEFPFSGAVARAIGHYLLIETTESRTADHIHAKEHELDIAQTMMRYHKGAANLWTSVYFGNEVSRAEYHQALDALRTGNPSAILEAMPCYQQAQEIAAEKRFFHWEMEFPEVFRDRYGREKDHPGFDAVVGNPPYVRQETLGEAKKFLSTYETYSGVADLYVYFMEKAHDLMRWGGHFGMIVSNKFMRANYGKGLRGYLSTNTKLREIVDFGELPVFAEASAMPAIILTRKEPVKTQAFRFAQIQTLDFKSLAHEVDGVSEELDQDALADGNWTLASAAEIRILNRIQRNSIPLNEYCEGKIRRGIITGLNEAFIIDDVTRRRLINADPKSEEIIKPCIVGDDVRKYEIKFNERYLIWTYIGIPIERYPAIFNHLKQFQDRLEKRWDKGEHWWELRACSYYDNFEKPKIIYPDIGMSCRFCLDELGLFSTNTTYFIPLRDFYLLALLNSSLIFQYLKRICAVLGEADRRGRLRFFGQYMEQLPIRQINFTTPPDERARLREKGRTLYERCMEEGSTDCVLGFVEHHLAADPERSDVVHDLLAFLAEEMIEMNQAKGEEIRGFLRWLEREIKAPIDTLKNRTALQSYYEKDLTELIDILKQNRRAIGVDPSERAFQERFEREFSASRDKLKPLMERIRKTDGLIDQVVYRLYGLTDEEIGVVEGRA